MMIAPWEEKQKVWRNIKWFDMPAHQKLAAFTINRYLPKKPKKTRIQIMVFNGSDSKMSNNIFFGINRERNNEHTVKKEFKNIPPGHVAWNIYILTGKKWKKKKNKINIYLEPRNMKALAGDVTRFALKALFPLYPDKKIKGIYLPIELIDYNYICKKHNVPCKWDKKQAYWICDHCSGKVRAW